MKWRVRKMEEGLFYSEAALLNRALFYSDYNDVNIFVEDEGKEYIYEDIFQRMFDYQIKIRKMSLEFFYLKKKKTDT